MTEPVEVAIVSAVQARLYGCYNAELVHATANYLNSLYGQLLEGVFLDVLANQSRQVGLGRTYIDFLLKYGNFVAVKDLSSGSGQDLDKLHLCKASAELVPAHNACLVRYKLCPSLITYAASRTATADNYEPVYIPLHLAHVRRQHESIYSDAIEAISAAAAAGPRAGAKKKRPLVMTFERVERLVGQALVHDSHGLITMKKTLGQRLVDYCTLRTAICDITND